MIDCQNSAPMQQKLMGIIILYLQFIGIFSVWVGATLENGSSIYPLQRSVVSSEVVNKHKENKGYSYIRTVLYVGKYLRREKYPLM
jgi:hypothetical protein